MKGLADAAHANAVAKGFWDEYERQEDSNGDRTQFYLTPDQISSKLCLIHSEVSEALEDLREGKMTTRFLDKESGATYTLQELEHGELHWFPSQLKPIGFPSELADIVIRVFDLCGAMGIDIEDEVKLKMAHNATRPRMHGKVI